MKDFKARTNGVNGLLAGDIFDKKGIVVRENTIKPGTLLIMNDVGSVELLGAATIDITNKHLAYYCNSWQHSVAMSGNGMVSIIPVSKQFEYEITFEAGDASLEDSFQAGPTDKLCVTAGKYAVADTVGDYVIGSVKAGNASKDLGGTLTIVTWGGDYEIPA